MKTIILDSTTKCLKAKLSGAPATTNPDFVASWADDSDTAFLEGSSDGTLNGATDVTMVAAPAASTRRVIKSIAITNLDTAPVTLVIMYDNNGTQRIIANPTLDPNDTWTCEGTFNDSGSIKGIGATGADGAPGAPGQDGAPGADGDDGISPHIGLNGNWYIGETDTGIPATGPAGADGAPGTPGQDGAPGADGDDGITPHIGENGNWYIGETDTGIPATGPAGEEATGEIWTALTGSYASATTFTFAGTDKDAKLIQLSLLTCTDSAGTTRRIGYVKSAVNNSGTITATVVTDSDLASGDKDFKVAYNRKVNDYLHLISIPGECIADASYSQGVWLQDIQFDWYMLPIDLSVLTPASGSGASLTVNLYKNTTALFSSAPDMGTNSVLRSQRPTTNSGSAGENISLRLPASAGATNKAADFQAKLFIVPQSIFTSF